MGFVAIPLTAKVAVRWTDSLTGTEIANVMHAECQGTPLLADLGNIAAAFMTWAQTITTNLSPTGVTLEDVTVTGLNTATDPQAIVNDGATAGSVTPGAAGVAALVRLVTASRGRSFRGRIYIGPLDEAAVTGGVITSGTVAIIDPAIVALQADLAALTPASTLVVASRVLATSSPVTGWLVEPLPAYQRRRGGR